MLHYLVFLGAFVSLVGISSYVFGTLKGVTKPNRVTWLLWAIAPLIASAAAVVQGVGWAALPVFMSGFGPLLVLAASFVNPNAYWKLERSDYLCGLFSVAALALWAITQNPAIAILFAILSDGSAALPTLMKMWTHPETESAYVFMGGVFSALTSFTAITAWTFEAYAFPIYLVTINIILIATFYAGKAAAAARLGRATGN